MTCGANCNFSCIGGAGATNNCSSSIESPSGTWPTSEAVEQEIVVPSLHGEHSSRKVFIFGKIKIKGEWKNSSYSIRK
jgi:dihydroorotase